MTTPRPFPVSWRGGPWAQTAARPRPGRYQPGLPARSEQGRVIATCRPAAASRWGFVLKSDSEGRRLLPRGRNRSPVSCCHPRLGRGLVSRAAFPGRLPFCLAPRPLPRLHEGKPGCELSFAGAAVPPAGYRAEEGVCDRLRGPGHRNRCPAGGLVATPGRQMACRPPRPRRQGALAVGTS